MERVISGNQAAAYGALLSRVQVVAAYPITPQTTIVEQIAELVAKGKMPARFISLESEHSAMATCIGASMGGVRTFTATASQGLALMHEMLHWASGDRLPIVMANCNRALGAPWNLNCDHTDSLAQRDTGWLQFYCESAQEVLDTIVQAYRICEQVLLPAMVNLDGFLLTHTFEPVDIPEQGLVDSYLPPYQPSYKLDISEPHAFGAVTSPAHYAALKYKMQRDMDGAREVVAKADAEFRTIFGRGYGLVEEYRCEDAEVAVLALGTMVSTARTVVDDLRRLGQKAGLFKIRMFRPFPRDEVRGLASRVSRIAVVDRDISLGHEGIVFQEVKSALYGSRPQVPVFGFIAGLGGQDVTPEVIARVVSLAQGLEWPEEKAIWMGLDR